MRTAIRLQVDPMKRGRRPAWGRPWTSKRQRARLAELAQLAAQAEDADAQARHERGIA